MGPYKDREAMSVENSGLTAIVSNLLKIDAFLDRKFWHLKIVTNRSNICKIEAKYTSFISVTCYLLSVFLQI